MTERAVAYHEAGHAYVAWRLKVGIRRKGASIVPDKETAGRVHTRRLAKRDHDNLEFGDSAASVRRAENRIMVFLGGMIAQRRFSPRSARNHHGHYDYHAAAELADRISGSERESSAYLNLLAIRTEALLQMPGAWACVTAIAEALMREKSLSGRKVAAIIDGVTKPS